MLKIEEHELKTFTKEEIEAIEKVIEKIDVIEELIKEHELGIKSFHEYVIYEKLKSISHDAPQVRSAFNMSKETTERLKNFSNVRRIPLQDLVELAVINLLEKYDK